MGKIVAVSITAIVVIVAVLAFTKVGHVIDAATQHFMLYYAGVLALVGLTGSVLISLLAVDRIVMTPGHRVMAQAIHRAFAFGTLAFLIIHITTEILAQRAHVIDAVVPFLSPFRTFYIGLGTIASDLILLLVITGILRKRFTTQGKAWRWRAIHYSSYVAFVFGVVHGLLGGRAAKPYVDWSYGFAIAVAALGLAFRFLAISLRSKEKLSTSPSVDRAGSGASPSMRAAAMAMAQAQLSSGQLGATVQVLPAGLGAGASTGSWTATALPMPGQSPASGPFPALGPAQGYDAAPDYGGVPAYVGSPPAADAYGQAYRAVPDPYNPAPDAYGDLGFTPLGAPPYGDDPRNGMRGRPYTTGEQPRPAVAGPARQPRYEPGYDGPPRFEGAPRGHGDVPQDTLSSYPYGPSDQRAQPVSPYPEDYADRSGPDRSGPDRGAPGGRPPRPGPMEPAPPRAAITAAPRPADRSSGPQPKLGPPPGTGPIPRVGTGPMPRADSGPPPAPPPRPGTGPMPRVGTGPMPRAGTGPMPRMDTGPMPRPGTGPMPRMDTGPMPRVGGGQPPRHGTGPAPRAGRGRAPRADTGSMPRVGTGPMPRPDTGPMPRPDTGPRPAAGSTRSGPRHGRPVAEPAAGPRTGSPPRPAARPSHRAKSPDPRYGDRPGPTGGGEWE